MAHWLTTGRLFPRVAAGILIATLMVALSGCARGEATLPPASAPGAATVVAAAGATPGGANCPPAGAARELHAAGATFPAPLYTRWFDEYARLCGVRVNYQPIGSGGGVKQHAARTIDFGASDGLLRAAQREAAPGTLMIPMTAGAVAVVVNLEGVRSGQIRLTPETLAAIFLGQITRWNDPRLVADNPGLDLPREEITVVHRADGSGTTNIFTYYLSQVSPQWREKVGAGNSIMWPSGIGGEGNAGVAGLVKQLPGAIGYVELAYAAQTQMPWVALRNRAGAFVEPSTDAVTAAMEGVDLPESMEVMITDSAAPRAYPIAGFTWVLLYRQQSNAARAQTLVHLLWWGIHDGQRYSRALHYAPLSPKAVAGAEALLQSVTVNGQPVLR